MTSLLAKAALVPIIALMTLGLWPLAPFLMILFERMLAAQPQSSIPSKDSRHDTE